MSGYVGAGSTSHGVNKMYVGVSGQAKAVQKAYVGVNGKARLWYQLGKPISSIDVGGIVKFKVNNVDYDWIVVQKGKPSDLYEMPSDVIWLLMKDVYTIDTIAQVSGSDANQYSATRVHTTYLNNTFFNMIESAVRNLIIEVKIPYYVRQSGKVVSGSNGLPTKVFLNSTYELATNEHNDAEGVALAYFSADTSNSRRVAYYKGNAVKWWTRSIRTWWIDYDEAFTGINANGSPGAFYARANETHGVRPCLVISSSAMVDDKGYIIGA